MPLRRQGLDPVPELASTREAGPVSRLAHMFGMNIWLVTGLAESQSVLANTTGFSNDIRPFVGQSSAVDGSDGSSQYIGGLGFTDPPEHTNLRRILTPEFTKRRLDRLRPRIVDIIEHQLDVVEEAGPDVDLVPTFAFPIPFLVICELLGLPDEDRQRFQRLGSARFDLTMGGVGSFGAVSESRDYLMDVVKAQRERPTDGLLGRIIEDHGHNIGDLELAGLADGLVTGGYETTASMLALGTLALLRDPDRFALVRDDDAAVARVVEELLRYLSVVQIAFPRFATKDMDLFGSSVRKGDVVICSLSGANRDARLGSGMEQFDPDRPTPHVAFGYGFHRCVGAELARMELRAAYPALIRRFPDMQLAVDPRELQFQSLSIVYGVKALPVRLH